MTVHTIASKFRRALRNGTGANFTQEQLQELARHGVLHLLIGSPGKRNQVPARVTAFAGKHPSPTQETCCNGRE